MTFVLNKCYGGWSLSDFAKEKLNVNTAYPSRTDSINKNLAELICKYGSKKCSGHLARLEVVEIPDECTDYEIHDYDGIETIIYVLNGNLRHA